MAAPPLAAAAAAAARAAFFDVDGTLAASNVVAAYAVARWRELAPVARAAWLPFFAGKALAYLALDAADRAAFNRAFYRNYAGRAASSKPAMAALVHQQYLAPRSFAAAQAHIRSLKQQGFRIVLVTGGLDFLVAPLAAEIAADAVFAASLVEEKGRFTGELQGAALGSAEKGAIVRAYAAENDISLASCHAYGDSIADLAMLESWTSSCSEARLPAEKVSGAAILAHHRLAYHIAILGLHKDPSSANLMTPPRMWSATSEHTLCGFPW
eukprot:SM000097S24763  [mRNA]  locus=s97:118579:123859:+ [translate_table: standard]